MSTSEEGIDKLLALPPSRSTKAVGELFGVKNETVRKWCRDGLLEGFKVGENGHWRVTEESIKKLIHQQHGDGEKK